ncbi:hypothetical protein DFA_09256 [Cavenderia fasciculata]|uniref:Uncharacterized protein n=1 Tax=Cavenderia fasciculata TaxID=261658 RepID=F4Q744_CACFS|nr:uncharacterized protein DFA_09256 [Cavenderia fasciculata]EGG16226.1 hypothetical protein DFA_09256 [Cavenderia fasciculata]|eukprot:XP_004354610.1 hypothetical protein DFA_09256 [Cavenderia fasciculata]
MVMDNDQLFKHILFQNRYLFSLIIEYIGYINRLENAQKIERDVIRGAQTKGLLLRHIGSDRKINLFYTMLSADNHYTKECRVNKSVLTHQYVNRQSYYANLPLVHKLKHPSLATRTYQTVQCVKWLLKNRYGNLLADKLAKGLVLDFGEVMWTKYATQERLKDFSEDTIKLLIKRAITFYNDNKMPSLGDTMAVTIITFGNKRLIEELLKIYWNKEFNGKYDAMASLGDVALFKRETPTTTTTTTTGLENINITSAMVVALKNGHTDLFRYIYETYHQEYLKENNKMSTYAKESGYLIVAVLFCKDLELMKKVLQEAKTTIPNYTIFPQPSWSNYIGGVLNSILEDPIKQNRYSIRHIFPSHQNQLETIRIVSEIYLNDEEEEELQQLQQQKQVFVSQESVETDLINNYLVLKKDWSGEYKGTTYTITDLSLYCTLIHACKGHLHIERIIKAVGRILSLSDDQGLCRYFSTFLSPKKLIEAASQSRFPSHIIYAKQQIPSSHKYYKLVPRSIETYNTIKSIGLLYGPNSTFILKRAIKANDLELVRLVAKDHGVYVESQDIIVLALETGNPETVVCVLESIYSRRNNPIKLLPNPSARIFHNPSVCHFIVSHFNLLERYVAWPRVELILEYAMYFSKMDVARYYINESKSSTSSTVSSGKSTRYVSNYYYQLQYGFNVFSTKIKRELPETIHQLFERQQEIIQLACRFIEPGRLILSINNIPVATALGSIGDTSLVDTVKSNVAVGESLSPGFYQELVKMAFQWGHLTLIKHMDYKYHLSKIYSMENVKLAIDNNYKHIIDFYLKERNGYKKQVLQLIDTISPKNIN